MRQVLAWAMDHDPSVAQRLAVVLAWWWLLRGRLAGQSPCCARLPNAPCLAAADGVPRSSG
jgi:hypothetical protein